MASFIDRLAACEDRMRDSLHRGEQVLGVGRCEDISEGGSIESGGAAWTFIMVTDQRLRWAPMLNMAFAASLNLDAVTSAAERTRAHRYAIRLEHEPISLDRWTPRFRLGSLKTGNVIRTGTFTRTTLAFSRRDTQAAIALRDQLAARESR